MTHNNHQMSNDSASSPNDNPQTGTSVLSLVGRALGFIPCALLVMFIILSVVGGLNFLLFKVIAWLYPGNSNPIVWLFGLILMVFGFLITLAAYFQAGYWFVRAGRAVAPRVMQRVAIVLLGVLGVLLLPCLFILVTLIGSKTLLTLILSGALTISFAFGLILALAGVRLED